MITGGKKRRKSKLPDDMAPCKREEERPSTWSLMFGEGKGKKREVNTFQNLFLRRKGAAFPVPPGLEAGGKKKPPPGMRKRKGGKVIISHYQKKRGVEVDNSLSFPNAEMRGKNRVMDDDGLDETVRKKERGKGKSPLCFRGRRLDT